MKFDCDFALETGGLPAESGKGTAALGEDGLTLAPASGRPVSLPWEQVSALAFADYKARLGLPRGTLTLSALGFKFEDFCRRASRLRNERLLTLDLAGEQLKHSMLEGSLERLALSARFTDACEFRIYETSLVALPEAGDYLRLPFRRIKEINEGDYTLEIISASGEVWRISGLGGKFAHLRDSLRSQMSALDLLVQKALAETRPGADPLALRAAAAILPEGRLAPLEDMERVLPGFTAGLEVRLRSNAEDAAEYGLLKELSSASQRAFGIKKGLMGSLSGDQYLLLFGFDAPARAAAVEAFTTAPDGTAGKDRAATYFYRFPEGGGWPEFLEFFNTAMTAVNFRRRPILLSDAQLADPRNAVYLGALARVPALGTLRGLYIGRLIHSDPRQWGANVKALLNFAAAHPEPGARWSAAGDPAEADERE